MIAAPIHDPALVDQPGIVSAVAAVAGLAIENENMHVQARAHLIETKVSRAQTTPTTASNQS